MTQKSSIVSVCGAPNAGKSTLINRLVGAKVTIVSPRPQTTRITIRGIGVYDDTQIVFVDTPGIMSPKGNRQTDMVNAAWEGVGEGEQIIFILDAWKGIGKDAKKVLKGLKGKKAVAVINKVDKIEKDKLLPLTAELAELAEFDKVFMISAMKSKGVDDLKKYLIDNSAEQTWPYPEDQLSDMNDRLFAAEITREKIFYLLQQELPYGVDVETEEFKEDDKKIVINQVVLTGTESHKKMIIGKGAGMIKEIGSKAREEMKKIFGKKIELYLHVKFSKDIAKNLE